MRNDDALELTFWGVRGSIPSPGADTAMVGGNTSCLEVTGGGTRLILDAGSGLRALGEKITRSCEHRSVTIFLSHVHWDHVMGLPFFTPLYMPGVEITIGAGPSGTPLREVLRRQMSAPMFPVDFDKIGSKVTTVELKEHGAADIGALRVTFAKLNHPDPVLAYRVSYGGRSIVYATDTEHREGEIDATLVALSRGADVLVYDAQYTPEEYAGKVGPSRKGWGHSTFEAGAAVARAAGVKTLALFHHDPTRSDEGVAEIVKRARAIFPHTVAAREGLSFSLEAQSGGRVPNARSAVEGSL
ncbi:MAG: MBL fold metallo-hydrolase [Polyangiaceae bacterium]|nr:MBL fold metallo-hydrolase [Polyangiaceae bacterium]